MQDTYSNDQLLAYGRRLAAHLCDQYFAAQPVGATIDGPTVLKLAPVRQLNLFVVQQLLTQWTQEMANLRSPYFDYEDPAVRQALTQLMNLLSRRIRLTRATYEPLLAQATADTLRGALDPAAIIEAKLLPTGQAAATPAQLRDALRYVEVNKALYQGFIDSLPSDQAQERDFLLSRFRLYRDAHYKDQQPADGVVSELAALVPVSLAELSGKPAAAAPAPKPTPQPAAEPTVAPISQPAPAPEPVAEAAPRSVEPVAPAVAAEPTPQPQPEPVATPEPTPAPVAAAPVVEPVAPTLTPERAAPLAASVAPVSTLNDKLASSRPAGTLNEKLGVRPSSTLAEAQPKVESLREAISINQRFSFINELFNGENMEYHAAIERLDTMPSADEARRYVTEELAQRYQWVRKDEHVNKLLRLIDRKFA